MAGPPTTFDSAGGDAAAAPGGGERLAMRLLVVYAAVLAVIAFSPTPVDREATGLLREVARIVPLLSYGVVEFTANILLFVPLGALLALALPHRRGLVVLISLAVTLAIESCQALFLAQRTPSLRDIVANTLGAAVGLVVVLILERRATAARGDARAGH